MYDIYVNNQFLTTPEGNRIEVPTLDLAKAIEEEWERDKSSHYIQKPLTSLVATALDKVADDRDHYVEAIVQSIPSDALLFWATSPESLEILQEKEWLPLLSLVNEKLGLSLKPTTLFFIGELSKEDQEKVKVFLYHQSIYTLSGVAHLVRLTHSFSLSYLFIMGSLSAQEVWNLAYLHEQEHERLWGEDQEMISKKKEVYKEFHETTRFLELINQKV